MNRTWLMAILALSLALLLVLKTNEKRTLVPYFKGERTLKLPQFEAARETLPEEKLHLLKLWESILTGRVAPLDRWLRTEYKSLALSHVFTPSGFHLSAVLWPLFLIFRKKRHKLTLLSLLAVGLNFLPGLGALKRMGLIKLCQEVFGIKSGFFLALTLDILWGSFSDSPAGFTYSFLFLGIIYSGSQGLTLVVWFFLAQILIALIQESSVSPVLLLASPLVNSCLALVLPVLFLLAFPLWDWQCQLGIFLLGKLQLLVSLLYALTLKLPLLEINLVLILALLLLLLRKRNPAIVLILLFSMDLNHTKDKVPVSGSYDWASGIGRCREKLVKGVWFETCSPRRGSRKKRLRKLSYPS